jgi:ABC-type multidrug transport system ATPase subunit/pSer/pThr/pTyr-binding forkhead associated (FHA) protein/ABC-type multidrug transport system permease subunit
MTTPTYPAVLDVANNALHALGDRAVFVVGRNPNADLIVTDLACSRQQFRLTRSADGRYFVEPLSQTTPTLCDDRPLSGPVELKHGAVIRAGVATFRFLTQDPSPPAPPTPTPSRAAQPLSLAHDGPIEETVMTTPSMIAEAMEQVQAGGDLPPPITVTGRMVIGRDPGSEVALAHPQVSRRHAVLAAISGRVELRDLGSANGTFVNGRRLVPGSVYRLAQGDVIDVGPYSLKYDGTRLTPRSRSNNVELTAYDIRRTVTDPNTGKPLNLLDSVSAVIRPKEFVCLLGPSGSGKSTLMNILSGRAQPDGGVVLMNGQDLHADFDALKRDIALVPQKDLLHDTLTVDQVLGYTACLRLPPDISSAEAQMCVTETLASVQLTPRRASRVKNLSGGQLKRASLANELLCKPSLLFLDEVTSGLDERTDRDMMQLFRELAEKGKTVVCITHSLTNVEQFCHLLVILTPGGKVAFIGSPPEALAYFQIPRLGDVYTRLEERPATEWQEAFLTSPYHTKYVKQRLPAHVRQGAEPAARKNNTPAQLAHLFFRQTRLLAGRYWAIWRGSRSALLAMLGQPFLVAFLLMIVFGNVDGIEAANERVQRTESLLFLLAVTSFWFGCNNAAKELVKERLIFTRERDFSLLVGSYYLSKLLVLSLFALIQVVLLYGLTKWYCAPPGSFASQFFVLAALATAGTALGLFLSAVSSSEDMAVSLIPVAVIPQVILSAGIAPLSGFGQVLARVGITTYWGKRALDGLLPHDASDLALQLGLAEGEAFWVALAVIVIHGLLFVGAALVVMTLQGRAAERMMQRLKRAVR